MSAFFERTKKLAEQSGGAGPLKDPAFTRDYPLLAEVLVARAVVEGRETNRMSLSVFCHDGLWKAILRDKLDQTALWISSGAFSKLWDVLEGALDDPETEWRQDRFQGHQEAKRVRKKT